MPTRILRDWSDSKPINMLSPQAERLYVRLIMKADDYGNFHADTKLLKGYLFPLLDSVREADISRWLAECEKAGVIALYGTKEKPLLSILKFGQRLRNSKHKFLPPTEEDLRRVAASRGHCLPEAHSETEAHSEGFARFWSAWPPHPRKANRKACVRAWNAGDCEKEVNAIVRHVNACKRSEDWLKGGGKYVPAPLTYIHQRRWDAPPPPAASDGGDDLPFDPDEAERIAREAL